MVSESLIIQMLTLFQISPNLLGSFSFHALTAGYNHSGWLNQSGDIYAMQDENHGYDIKILDLSDFTNISVISVFNSGVNANSMAHNALLKTTYFMLLIIMMA